MTRVLTLTGSVASALNVCQQTGRMILDTLSDALRQRHMLLILDNCEHLVQSCAELVETLLRDCPNLRVLSTSRQALRIAGGEGVVGSLTPGA